MPVEMNGVIRWYRQVHFWGSSDSMWLNILLRSSTGSMSSDNILVVSEIGWYGVHADVQLLVSDVFYQNLCNIV